MDKENDYIHRYGKVITWSIIHPKLTLIISFSLILFIFVVGGIINKYIEEQHYYELAEEEYTSLNRKIYSTSDHISEVEQKYSNNEGYFSLYKFTNEDLNDYANFIGEQQQNYENIISWVINNDKYLRHLGKSELFISEKIKEWRSIIEDLEQREKEIAEAKIYVETLGSFSNLFNFSS